MRLAIYARYSDDLQNERSIDDQVRLCREYAAQLGAAVVGVYADYALSGSSLKTRPEAQRLLVEARRGLFDIVVTEALDRISRDQEDIAHIYKRLVFARVRLVTLAAGEGEIGELHIGLEGTMNALFLRDLAAKVRRGQRGRALAGFVPGGRSYGYDVVRELHAKGELLRGRRKINEAEAAVVRRIFTEYAAGKSARAIAAGLNRDGIPSPSGKEWWTSTINGQRSRATGMLWNEAYTGRLLYNRTTFIKDPETGRRISRPLPASERVATEMPELRIISDELWQAAVARKARYAGMPAHIARRPRHVFSGLVRCTLCGGPFTVVDRARMGCSAHREKHRCGNNRTVQLDELERRVFDGLRRHLLAPESIALFVKEYAAERAPRAAGAPRPSRARSPDRPIGRAHQAARQRDRRRRRDARDARAIIGRRSRARTP